LWGVVQLGGDFLRGTNILIVFWVREGLLVSSTGVERYMWERLESQTKNRFPLNASKMSLLELEWESLIVLGQVILDPINV
jgi:hypothetical protein